MLKIPQCVHNINKLFKLSAPARIYNITIDHSRRILSTTMYHNGICNHKTLVVFYELICNDRNEDVPDDFDFTLYEKDSDNNVV